MFRNIRGQSNTTGVVLLIGIAVALAAVVSFGISNLGPEDPVGDAAVDISYTEDGQIEIIPITIAGDSVKIEAVKSDGTIETQTLTTVGEILRIDSTDVVEIVVISQEGSREQLSRTQDMSGFEQPTTLVSCDNTPVGGTEISPTYGEGQYAELLSIDEFDSDIEAVIFIEFEDESLEKTAAPVGVTVYEHLGSFEYSETAIYGEGTTTDICNGVAKILIATPDSSYEDAHITTSPVHNSDMTTSFDTIGDFENIRVLYEDMYEIEKMYISKMK